MLILTKFQVESLKRATEGMGNDATTEYRLMFIQLTEVQARCTELIQEAREGNTRIIELEKMIDALLCTIASPPSVSDFSQSASETRFDKCAICLHERRYHFQRDRYPTSCSVICGCIKFEEKVK